MNQEDINIDQWPEDKELPFTVVYWPDEEARDQGISDVHGDFPTLQMAMQEAKKLYHRQGFAAVEVESTRTHMMIYHISDDDNGRTQEEGPYEERI